MKALIDFFYDFFFNAFPVFLKLTNSKFFVFFQRDWGQPHRNHRLIEGAGWGSEYLTHEMSFGTSKKKCCVRTTLDISTQGGFYVPCIRIVRYFLEFVNCYNTWLVGLVEIVENLAKCC